MIVPAPENVRKSVGTEAAEAIGQWFEDILQSNAVSRDEYRTILTRFDIVERDVSELKQDMKDFRHGVNMRFDSINERFERMNDSMNEALNARFASMNASIDQRFDSMKLSIDKRFDSFDQRFDGMNKRIDERFDRIYERIGTMMKWMVGTVGLFGTLITTLLAISQFAK